MAIVTNIVLTCDLNCKLDLQLIYNSFTYTKLFNGPFYRCDVNFKTSLVCAYKSGKILSVGAKSFEEGRRNIRRLARVLQKKGFNIRLSKITIQNIAATDDLKKRYRLSKVKTNLGFQCKYTKEVFPNLRFTSKYNPKQKVTLSSTGKYILTGVKSLVELKALDKEFRQSINHE